VRAEQENVVTLTYRRSGKLEAYDGRVMGGGRDFQFDAVSFASMLERVGELLRSAPGSRLVIKREEAPYPLTLPENIEELLRTDVQAAIKLLTVPPQRVVVAPLRTPARAANELLGTLRYGYDTLADSIGELVYLKCRFSRADRVQVEDPVSGRWEAMTLLHMAAHCGNLPLALGGVLMGDQGRWVAARVTDILALDQPRYYLPRRWNESGGWISHETLSNIYAFYQKEKANAEQSS
jgi:hypothetical protein